MLLLVALVLVLPAGAASAASALQWYQHYEQGLEAARAGDWSAALEDFRAAERLEPRPRERVRTYGNRFLFGYDPAFQQARALVALERWDEAAEALERSDAAAVTAEEERQALRRRLEQGQSEARRGTAGNAAGDAAGDAAAAASRGRLAVESDPAGAEVRVDGRRAGRTPLAPLDLAAGPHRVELRAPGRRPWIEDVEVEAGETMRLQVVLSPPTSSAGPSSAGSTAAGAGSDPSGAGREPGTAGPVGRGTTREGAEPTAGDEGGPGTSPGRAGSGEGAARGSSGDGDSPQREPGGATPPQPGSSGSSEGGTGRPGTFPVGTSSGGLSAGPADDAPPSLAESGTRGEDGAQGRRPAAGTADGPLAGAAGFGDLEAGRSRLGPGQDSAGGGGTRASDGGPGRASQEGSTLPGTLPAAGADRGMGSEPAATGGVGEVLRRLPTGVLTSGVLGLLAVVVLLVAAWVSRRPVAASGHPGERRAEWRLQTGADRRIGGYHVLDVLGRGGMATTYRAHRIADGRTLALKIPHDSGDPTYAERFVREGRLGETLHHPGIVRIHEAGEDRGLAFLAMELLPGRTLEEEIADHPEGLPLRRALEIARDVAEALDYAHGKGIVHRDLKPANVMLLPDGGLKVMDFGVARVEGQPGLTTSRVFFGSPIYAAPELVESERIGPRSDLYSLGILLFEMLEGEPPFTHGSVFQLLEMHRSTPLPAPETLPRPLPAAVWHVLDRLCAKNPDDRYPDAQTLLVDLHRLLFAEAEGGTPVASREEAGSEA